MSAKINHETVDLVVERKKLLDELQELTPLEITKEPLWQSERFRVFLVGVILEILILLAPYLGFDNLDPEILKTVAGSLAALVLSFILGRSYRNTVT